MDFCSEPLKPFMVTEKPCVDGHEPEVLMCNNNVPFLCEGFIRSPVDLYVEFIVPIDIARIVIGPEVNDRYASLIRITTHYSSFCNKNNNLRRSSLPGSSAILNPIKVPLSRAPSLSQIPTKTLSEESQSAGQWCIGKQKLVVLRNRQYKHFLNIPLPLENKGVHVYESHLRHNDRFSLRNVYAITLTILRVIPTGAPGLKFLEIWGQPAVRVELNTKLELVNRWNTYKNIRSKTVKKFSFYDKNPDKHKEEKKPENVIDNHEIPNDIDIPDEFLDPLTCEVMVIPLLLPSGNNIDNQSLDRFIAHEALWGRQPSDPFTGIMFRSNFSPVPNVPLKGRIDKFILLNKVEVSGRTLHSFTQPSPSGKSSLLSGKRRASQEYLAPKKLKPSNLASTSSKLPPPKSVQIVKRTSSVRPVQAIQNGPENGHSLVKRLGSTLKLSCRPSTSNSYITLNEPVQSPKTPPTLSLYRNRLKCSCSNEGFYGLTCPHTLCPPCLLKHRLPDGIIECPECNVRTSRTEVYRKHAPSIFSF